MIYLERKPLYTGARGDTQDRVLSPANEQTKNTRLLSFNCPTSAVGLGSLTTPVMCRAAAAPFTTCCYLWSRNYNSLTHSTA